MANAVADAIVASDALVVEAPTGTGKTLAYLLPALRSGRTVLVSTATINLQEQLFSKDLPLAEAVIGRKLDVALLKGISNYVCRLNAVNFQAQPMSLDPQIRADWEVIREWMATTETGERSELSEVSEGAKIWSEVTTSAAGCLGSKCPYFSSCFAMAARERAREASLVVVNHHLFFSDLAANREHGNSVLPDVGVLIFDEAHQIENIAAPYFGTQLSQRMIDGLCREVRALANAQQKAQPGTEQGVLWGEVKSKEAGLSHAAHAFFGLLATMFPEHERSVEREVVFGHAQLGELEGLQVDLEQAFKDLGARLVPPSAEPERRQQLRRRLTDARASLKLLMETSDATFVYEVERIGNYSGLRATPIKVGSFLRDGLIRAGRALVLTSATITVRNSFNFMVGRLGLHGLTTHLQLESSFDYGRQAVLYVPEGLPDPRGDDFIPFITDKIEALVTLTEGRALLLFTSYKNMNEVAAKLRGVFPWTLMVQGEAPKTVLLERFKEDESSVLLATQSFWEGVDVPGDALSLVVIDKLPFQSPGDPLVKWRCREIEESGKNPFREYSLPMAILALKQGFGRLIRSSSDLGIVTVLDRRLVESRYGDDFIVSLPKVSRTRILDKVERWWALAKERAAQVGP